MKAVASLSFCSLLLVFLTSCGESVDSHKAGGAAFSDSELGRKLDANTPLESNSVPTSFEQWREE